MANDRQSGSPGGLYEQRIGTPTTDDEVNGFWLFGFGVLLGLAGVLLFFLTESATTARGDRVRARGAGSAVHHARRGDPLPAAAGGNVHRIPRDDGQRPRRRLVREHLPGRLVYRLRRASRDRRVRNRPHAHRARGDDRPAPVRPGLRGLRADAGRGGGRDGRARRDERGVGVDPRGVGCDRIGAFGDERGAVGDGVGARSGPRGDGGAAGSKARFELFEDAGGKPRWRLRHRNGNVIATAGQGYSSRGKAQKGLHSVRRNALGAGILRIETPVAEAEAIAVDDGPEPADAADPNVAVPSDDEAIASKATFELFEDAGGEWRWRLRHDNGNIISDSGEGYASKSNAKRALGRVREHVAAADYLRVDPTAFEVFRNAGGEWRWRLIHENGNVLADSGEGYSSRSKARQGLDSVQSNAAEAALEAVGDDGVAGDADGNPNATFELYEDAAEEYRWRLRHRNGNIIADSGEGYASESNARDAIGRVREYAPDADVLEVGNAAFGSTRTPPTSGAGGSATATGTSSRTPAKGTPPGRTRSRGHGREGERPGAEAETVEAEE